MKTITEFEFERLFGQIIAERDVIIRHNPVGSGEEIILWMLLGTLVSYLSIPENEAPCFNGKPDAAVYRDAVRFILKGRMEEEFDLEPYLASLR